MRWSVRTRARLVPTVWFVINQTLYSVDSDDPTDVVDWFLTMNPDHLASERITQDVLLLCGEHDAFQPPAPIRAQAEALTTARSVTVRMFTEAEHAAQHCQMGNLDLARRVITSWWRHPDCQRSDGGRLAPVPRSEGKLADPIVAGGHQIYRRLCEAEERDTDHDGMPDV